MEYTLFWLSGRSEVVTGNDPADAMTLAGYSNGAVRALDFYDKGDVRNDYTFKKDGDRLTWIKTKKAEAKESLLTLIEVMSEEQLIFLDKLVRTLSSQSRLADLIELADIKGTFDYALPQQTVDAIKKLYPKFNTQFHIMDYREKSCGEIASVTDALVYKIVEILKQ